MTDGHTNGYFDKDDQARAYVDSYEKQNPEFAAFINSDGGVIETMIEQAAAYRALVMVLTKHIAAIDPNPDVPHSVNEKVSDVIHMEALGHRALELWRERKERVDA